MKKIVGIALLVCLLTTGCGINKTDIGLKEETQMTTSMVEQEKEPDILTQKVSSETYHDIDKLEERLAWQMDDVIIKRFESFMTTYGIEQDRTSEGLLLFDNSEEVPLGAFVGTWRTKTESSLKEVRIDLEKTDKEKSKLTVTLTSDKEEKYEGVYNIKDGETTFDNQTGLMIRTNKVKDAFNIKLVKGELEVRAVADFAFDRMPKVNQYAYQGILNNGPRMMSMETLLKGIKVAKDDRFITIEASDQAHLGYLLVTSNQEGKKEPIGVPMEFNNLDILAYTINQDKQLAKVYTHPKEEGQVTYIYHTPLGNYEVVVMKETETEPHMAETEFFPNPLTTSGALNKREQDRLFYEQGETMIFGKAVNDQRPRLKGIDKESIGAKVLHVYYQEMGYLTRPFERERLQVIPDKESTSGVIVEHRLGSTKTKQVATYKVDEKGDVTSDNKQLHGRNILYQMLPIVTTVETEKKARERLKETQWVGDDYQWLTAYEDYLQIEYVNQEGEYLDVTDYELVAPDYLVLTGHAPTNKKEIIQYHLFFYPDESIRLMRTLEEDKKQEKEEFKQIDDRALDVFKIE